ncbi:unnamed protein product [Oppiella nova]|uniref:Uncharacterized protein n=1 Tax=Oppiella nova TaxID=334625 RepID=A0A7R9LPU9_9ACAR|nr:unnamed protein product [Oppiella nova]CAG2165723.1 unnamed protein product [Oppiella nova]
MKFIFNVPMSYILYSLTLTALGNMAGAFSGFLYKYINRQLTLTIMTFQLTIFGGLAPFCPNIWLLYLSVFLSIMGGGVFDSSVYVWVIEMWGKHSPPILQLSGLLFGLGSICGPILVKPYLTGDLNITDTLPQLSNYTNNTNNIHNLTHYEDINNSVDRRAKLQTPFMIAGCVGLIGPVIMLIISPVKYGLTKIGPQIDPNPYKSPDNCSIGGLCLPHISMIQTATLLSNTPPPIMHRNTLRYRSHKFGQNVSKYLLREPTIYPSAINVNEYDIYDMVGGYIPKSIP